MYFWWVVLMSSTICCTIENRFISNYRYIYIISPDAVDIFSRYKPSIYIYIYLIIFIYIFIKYKFILMVNILTDCSVGEHHRCSFLFVRRSTRPRRRKAVQMGPTRRTGGLPNGPWVSFHDVGTLW